MLFRYKPDDGRNARQIAFWLGLVSIAFGCSAFSGLLDGSMSLRAPLMSALPKLPILGADLSASNLISFILFLVLSFFWVRYLAAEKNAQHLIEVETELNKVTWPSFKEASNSSVVVIITVILLMGFLALADFVLSQVFDAILWN